MLTSSVDLTFVKRAHVWVFYGSDIGAPRQPNLVHASSEALERWLLQAWSKNRSVWMPRFDDTRRGWAGSAGGRAVCDCGMRQRSLHNVADRWPEAIDVGLLARDARALANGALEFAQQEG